ncbi:MAG: integration host factor subunit beta [Candidatus Omnitrophota bacterium]|nr:MAG: integration host factor subunit beta [Candidatus Omnitrophota bacterium]
MTKKEIAIRVADETGIKQIVTKKVLQKSLDAIIDILASGQNIELRNFGVFKVKSRKARIARNPRTGETVPVPPKKAVVFKPGLVMKQRVR